MSRESRRNATLDLMERQGVDALLLRMPPNFAWYTDGGDNRVDHASPVGVADVLVTRERDYIVTNTIEAARMRAEQTPGFEIVEYPWYEDAAPLVADLANGGSVGCDVPGPNVRDVAAAVAPLRWVLDAEAVERYRAVGADAAAALGEAASRVAPGTTELEAAAGIVAACRRRALFSPVVLAAADERVARYRHPLPGTTPIRDRVMLVVCAERGGLYANLTQFVDLAAPSAEVARRMELCATILRRMRDEATKPGRTLGQAMADCRRFYADAGYPDEWTLHHQGGTTGYASREVVATPASDVLIQSGMAFAWNPSITGAKAEDTFLLSDDGPITLARAGS